MLAPSELSSCGGHLPDASPVPGHRPICPLAAASHIALSPLSCRPLPASSTDLTAGALHPCPKVLAPVWSGCLLTSTPRPTSAQRVLQTNEPTSKLSVRKAVLKLVSRLETQKCHDKILVTRTEKLLKSFAVPSRGRLHKAAPPPHRTPPPSNFPRLSIPLPFLLPLSGICFLLPPVFLLAVAPVRAPSASAITHAARTARGPCTLEAMAEWRVDGWGGQDPGGPR